MYEDYTRDPNILETKAVLYNLDKKLDVTQEAHQVSSNLTKNITNPSLVYRTMT